MPQTKRRIWLSYDLGLRGNYDALYEWLDRHGAVECGESLATFSTNLTPDKIKVELMELLGDSRKNRIYLIDRVKGGKYLIGQRKAAPWAGYFEAAVESALDS